MAESPRTAVVTGAARGIGRAIAERLAAEGHRIALLDVDPSVRRVASDLAAGGVEAFGVTVDVAEADQVAAAMDEVVSRSGPVGILVNNAGFTPHRAWRSVTPEDWDRVMAVNLRSGYLFARAAVDGMAAGGWGRIVNISSVTFLGGQRHLIDYVTSKGGVVGFTRALAREVGGEGVTVNAVLPGAIRTEAELESFPDQQRVAEEQALVQSIPRRGVPEDVAHAVAFFCSDGASFVTGQTLAVDGGWFMN